MSNGIYDYLKTDYRPKKRKAQRELYEFAAKHLPRRPLTVVDLPSVDLNQHRSRQKMVNAGLNVGNYYAYENNTAVYNSIRVNARRKTKTNCNRIIVRNKNVLTDMADRSTKLNKFNGYYVDLFNLDFCSAMADTHDVFKMIQGISMHFDTIAAVIVTCSLRSAAAVKAEDALDHAFYRTLPELYGINTALEERRTYADTAPMVSRCFILTPLE